MAIPKKGSRKIVVKDKDYRWLIRRKATYGQVDYGCGYLHVAIELSKNPKNTLVIFTDRRHPQDGLVSEVIPVTPSDIQRWIQDALELGWNPALNGSPFIVKIEEGRMKIAN